MFSPQSIRHNNKLLWNLYHNMCCSNYYAETLNDIFAQDCVDRIKFNITKLLLLILNKQ